jgi:hypothetical protein
LRSPEAGAAEFLGGCACGQVRWRAEGPTSDPTLCHCSDCRRTSGAPVVAWVTFQAARFRFVRGTPRTYKSSEHVVRSFCPACGTSLTYAHDAHPDAIDVTTCSLDHPERLPPADHTWTRSQLAWLATGDALPRFPRTRAEGAG